MFFKDCRAPGVWDCEWTRDFNAITILVHTGRRKGSLLAQPHPRMRTAKNSLNRPFVSKISKGSSGRLIRVKALSRSRGYP